jgi:hypothetical protein
MLVRWGESSLSAMHEALPQGLCASVVRQARHISALREIHPRHPAAALSSSGESLVCEVAGR